MATRSRRLAAKQTREAELLRERFDEIFWMEDLQCYALALDGEKRPCCVRTSNAGHTLMSGIAHPQRAEALARRVNTSDAEAVLLSGTGLPTVGVLASLEQELGKPVVSDLREGKVTLPLVLALERAPQARPKVEAVLNERGFQSVAPEEILGLVRQSGAVERTQARAAELAAAAHRALEPFADSTYKRALEALPQFVLSRDY